MKPIRIHFHYSRIRNRYWYESLSNRVSNTQSETRHYIRKEREEGKKRIAFLGLFFPPRKPKKSAIAEAVFDLILCVIDFC